MFNTNFGVNVKLSECGTRASWVCEHSGGWVYSSVPLEAGDSVLVKAEGSGHYDVGYITKDPQSICDTDKNTPSFKQLNEVKIHKKDCAIPVSLNSNHTELSSEYNNITYKRTIDPAEKIWVTIYIKFGDIKAFLQKGDTKLKFSIKHGSNIKLSEDYTRANAIKLNPGAICFLRRPLQPGREYRLRCSPVADGGRYPSRYHLELGVSSVDPATLLRNFQHLFRPVRPVAAADIPQVINVEMFERDVCEGVYVIKLGNDNTLYYQHERKHQTQVLSTDQVRAYWLMLDLYRVAIEVVDDERPYDTVGGAGWDVPDAVHSQPRPETHPDIRPQASTSSQLQMYLDRSRTLQHDQQWFRDTMRRMDGTEAPAEVTVMNDQSQPINPSQDDAPDRQVSRLADRVGRMEIVMQQLLERTQAPDIAAPVPVPSHAAQDSENFMIQICSRLEKIERNLTQLIDQRLATETRLTGNGDDLIVKSGFVEVIGSLDPVPVIDKLFERNHITDEEREILMNKKETNTTEACRQLFSIMVKKKITRRILEPILKESAQAHLIPRLFKS